MKPVLLIAAAPIAALALAPAPAGAQFAGDPPMTAAPGTFERWAAHPTDRHAFGVNIHRGFGLDGKRRHHGRRHRGSDTIVISDGFGWYGGEWALYNNRSWEPDSYNDWWHDNPSRAYPRWMQNNQNCDRMWWGGGVWRCTW